MREMRPLLTLIVAVAVSGTADAAVCRSDPASVSGGAPGFVMPPQQVPGVSSLLDRGHRILMDKGLQVQAQVSNYQTPAFDQNLWSASGFTGFNFQWSSTLSSATLALAPAGTQWGRWGAWGADIKPAELPFLRELVSLQDSDEQDITDPSIVQQVSNNLASWRLEYPKVLSFTNQSGNSATGHQLLNYMQAAEPDMLMFDAYVFNGSTVDWGNRRTLFNYMQKYRMAALGGHDGSGKRPIPYAQYIQARVLLGHTTSESELGLYYFASWAFGYTYLSAFIYNNPLANLQSTLFAGDGDVNPTATFYEAAEANRQSSNLGPALVRLLSTDIRMVQGQYGGHPAPIPLPINVSAWDTGADSYMTSITVANRGTMNGGLPGGVLVGYFKILPGLKASAMFFDGTSVGEQYFMIVNALTDRNGSGAQTQQDIHIEFDFGASGITRLLRLSRNTGDVEIVPLVPLGGGLAYSLDLVLDGGVGDLFKFDTGAPFVGP